MRANELKIEPVKRLGWKRAISFLTGSGGSDPMVRARQAGLQRVLGSVAKDRVRMFTAKEDKALRAAAIAVENPGHFAAIFHSPALLMDVDDRALTRVLEATAKDALQRGMSFAQSMVLESMTQDRIALEKAGFDLLAELVYMQTDIGEPGVDEPPEGNWHWENVKGIGDRRLMELIERTYIDSLDCPGLSQYRSMQDVLEGHRNSGLYRPASWWVLSNPSQDAGCLFVNDERRERVAELVYLGVVPEFRRRGVGRMLLRKALRQAAHRGKKKMSLAVDARNEPAIHLYRSAGFSEIFRRFVYIYGDRPPKN